MSKEIGEVLGRCADCGDEIYYSGCAVDRATNKIYCHHCTDKVSRDVLLQAVSSYTDEDNNPIFLDRWTKHGCSVWKEGGKIAHAWTNGGSTAWFIKEEERDMEPEEYLDMMIHYLSLGMRRCSECGKTIEASKVAGYPLFAGINCSKCWKKHLEQIEEERKAGDICHICNQPRSLCCC